MIVVSSELWARKAIKYSEFSGLFLSGLEEKDELLPRLPWMMDFLHKLLIVTVLGHSLKNSA